MVYFTPRLTFVVVKGPPVPPGKPRADDIETDAIKVSWKPPVNHEAYAIRSYTLKYRKAGDQGDFIAVESVGPEIFSVTIESLASDTEYEIVAVTHNKEGSSGPSEVLEVKTSNSKYLF